MFITDSTGRVVKWSGCVEECIYCVSVSVMCDVQVMTGSDLNHIESIYNIQSIVSLF